MHHGHHLGFRHSGPDEPHGRQVHVGRQDYGLVDFFDFLGGLDGALGDDALDQLGRGGPGGQAGIDTQPIEEPKIVIGPVRRQEVNGPALAPGLFDKRFGLADSARAVDAGEASPFRDRRLGPPPDDIVDREIVAEEMVGAVVDIEDSHKPGNVRPEIIKERAVLPEMKGVIEIVHRALVVPEQENDAG